MKVFNFSRILAVLCSTQTCLFAQPPKAPSQPVTETYFGKQVNDPYRNLENLKDTAVQQWMKAQTDYTHSVLNKIPGRQRLLDKMKELDSRKSVRIVEMTITDNDIYFYIKITPGDETGKLYTRKGLTGDETLLFDPAEYNKSSELKYVVHNINPADDGTLVSFKLSPNGSEKNVQLIMDVNNKKLYPEKIDRTVFAISWLPDNSGFFYTRFQSDDIHEMGARNNTKVFLHKPGEDPSTDKEFFSNTIYPDLGIRHQDAPMIIYDKGSRYLFALVDGWSNAFYAPASELKKSSVHWKQLFKPEDEVQRIIATDKDLFILTSKNAPRFQILKTSLQNPDLEHATVVVAEDPEATMTSFRLTNEALYYTVTRNGVEAMLYRLPWGVKKAVRLKLPFAAGNISLYTKGSLGKGEGYLSRDAFRFADIWVTLSGWTSESKRYRYQPGKNEFKPESLSAAAEYPELTNLVVEEVTVPSHDGVKVPLSIIYKKGIKKDGSNPVSLMGYGAYGSLGLRPGFGPLMLLWTTEGGIVAIAHVRGGGELGEEWHKGGMKTTKPNTWKDMISCAEYLVSKKYTSPGKLSINGGSAGGILIGRAMTERPDLFAVAIPTVGMLNPLRFEETPNGGPGNVAEFGTVKDSTECMALIEMDAYLHVKSGEKYPATLVTAGMNDPRVIAWQPAKFAARLQAENGSGKPILLRIDYESGHGIGDTKSVIFERAADGLSFALWQLGHPDFQLKEKKAF